VGDIISSQDIQVGVARGAARKVVPRRYLEVMGAVLLQKTRSTF
jgi:hypothetical protein